MEKSNSGAFIYRYDDLQPDPLTPAGGTPHTDEIGKHVTKYIGEVATVYHELVSTYVHIDVYWVKPTDEHPFHTLVTSGMSDLPMNTSESARERSRVELCLSLPRQWPVEQALNHEEMEGDPYWPVWWLKFLARFPHQYNSWLGQGHTIPDGSQPFVSYSRFCSFMLFPPMLFDEGFRQLKTNDYTIYFYNLIPLYPEELDLKLNQGIDPLLGKLDEHRIADVWAVDRVNVATGQ